MICQHENKVYASFGRTLTVNPPIHIKPWICKDCGFEGEERDQGTSLDDEYNEVKSKFSYPKHIFKYGDKVKRYNGEIGIVVELLKDYNSGNFTNYEMYRVDITDLNGKIVKRGILMAQHELTLLV